MIIAVAVNLALSLASKQGNPSRAWSCGMVTEPTPFGLHDLRLAAEVARDEMGLPVGVVVNRDGVGDRGVDEYCADEGIPILMRIPLDQRIAEAYSEGVPLVEARPEYRGRFLTLWERLEEHVHRKGGKANEGDG